MTTPYAMTYAGDRAIRAAREAGLVSDELWRAHRAAIQECPTSWYNWYLWATRLAANEDREAAHLDWIDSETAEQPLTEAATVDAAADWTPEGVPF